MQIHTQCLHTQCLHTQCRHSQCRHSQCLHTQCRHRHVQCRHSQCRHTHTQCRHTQCLHTQCCTVYNHTHPCTVTQLRLTCKVSKGKIVPWAQHLVEREALAILVSWSQHTQVVVCSLPLHLIADQAETQSTHHSWVNWKQRRQNFPHLMKLCPEPRTFCTAVHQPLHHYATSTWFTVEVFNLCLAVDPTEIASSGGGLHGPRRTGFNLSHSWLGQNMSY